MGTNYYLRERKPHRTVVTYEGDPIDGKVLNREEQYRECHLCKLSWGWLPHMACDPISTIGVSFRSLRSMEEYAAQHPEMAIVDEYGDEHALSEFSDMVRRWGNDGFGCPKDAPPHDHLGLRSWVDDEGFEFSAVEFY